MSGDRGIIILGAGGHGKSAVSMALMSAVPVTAILDDDPCRWGMDVLGIPVLGPLSQFNQYPNHPAVITIGNNETRRKTAEAFPGATWSHIICKTAYIAFSSSIKEGTVIFPLTVIGAEVQVGAHVIINAHVTVGHETIVEDYAQIAVGVQIAGGAVIEEGAMIGAGSIVGPKVRIGRNAIVGAGAVVIRDVETESRVFGIPAKPKY
jgi:acetyltransferase EpsM